MRTAGIALVVVLVAACTAQPAQSVSKDDLCIQSAALGRTIASSARTADEARAITEHAIASNKYPALGDKVIASVGGVVILGTSAGMTPDQIHDRMLSECRGNR